MKKPKAIPPKGREPPKAKREKALRQIATETATEDEDEGDEDPGSDDEQQEPPLLLTKDEAARALNVCKRTVDYLLQQNALEKVKIRTAVRVTRRSVLALAGQRTPEAAE